MAQFSRRNFLAASTTIATLAAADSVVAGPTARVRSISAVSIAPDGRLVIADWRSGALHALDLPVLPKSAARPFNVKALEVVIGQIAPGRLRATALAWGAAGHAIIAVEIGGQPQIATVAPDGRVSLYDPDRLLVASQPIEAVVEDALIWGQRPVRSLTVTSLIWDHGDLLVAGVANSDFSSALRRISYPFRGVASSTAVEMYHAVHNQIETRAPIRAMTKVDLDGIDHLIAAYTCTPLVTMPMSELKAGSKVRAKTIAELGFGNTPLSLTPFQIEQQGQKSAWVLVANSTRSADLIALPAIAAAAKSGGVSVPVNAPFEPLAGVRATPLPLGNLIALVDQGPEFLLALRRDPEVGDLELASFRKGAFFRLSDFDNEYDMPGYAYPSNDAFQQQYIRPFHRILKQDEGYEKLIR